MANVELTANVVNNENESELRAVRNAIIAEYIEGAFEVFKKHVDINEVEMADFLKVTENATIVFTQPSEETLKADQASENPRFKKGRRFGSTQWWKKTQEVGTALSVLTSYSSYLRYMDSKAHAAERLNKRVENTASDMQALSIDEQAKHMAKMFGVSVEAAKEMLLKNK